MFYKINPKIALRSWRYVPHAYYIEGERNAKKLSPEQFDLLSRCDGLTSLETSDTLQELVDAGLALPVEKGDVPSKWSLLHKSETRYFNSAYLVITGKCNFNCLHCFMAADNSHLMTELSFQDCIHILDECVDCGIQTIVITGGEPFLHPYFMNILKACHERHLTVQDINTNASLINEKILNDIHAMGLNPRLKISFDCLSHHDWMRNMPGIEQTTIEAIQLCHKLGFRVEVQTNVNRVNLDTLFQTADYFDKAGIEEMRIIRTTEAPRWVSNANGQCLDLEEYYEEMTKFSAAYIASPRHMTVDIWQFLTLVPEKKCYYYRPIALSGHDYRDNFPVCAGNRSMVSITSAGEVVPCAQMSGYYEKNNMSLGNIHHTSLRQLLSNSKYLDKVTCPISSVHEHDSHCSSCSYWKLCAGGCRAIALALTHDELARDPAKCIFFTNDWMTKIDHALLNTDSEYHNGNLINGRPVRESVIQQ